VTRAEEWKQSSLPIWLPPPLVPWLDPGPVARHAGWLDYVQTPQSAAELAALRKSVVRNRPYGSGTWVERTVQELGLESSLRPPGRPRKRCAFEAGSSGLFGEKLP
jgi:putative transposase